MRGKSPKGLRELELKGSHELASGLPVGVGSLPPATTLEVLGFRV